MLTPSIYPLESVKTPFFELGATKHQRLIRGGNQVGKSFGCAFEAALHLTGKYPSWWKGKRFDRPVRAWIVGVSAQLTRDGQQRQLTAKGGEFGTGTIPLAALAWPRFIAGSVRRCSHRMPRTREAIIRSNRRSKECGRP